MIKATLIKKMDECRIQMHGHAEAERNEQDNDLVCCAASTMVQQLMWGVMHRSMASIEGHCEPGDVELVIRCDNEKPGSLMNYTLVWDRMDFLFEGLSMLEEEYPDSVDVQIATVTHAVLT